MWCRLEIVTYIIDRNINYTNVCNVYCKFCAFMRTEKRRRSLRALARADRREDQELEPIGGTQVLMQGGHHPKLGIDYYLNLLHTSGRTIRTINIHGFSAAGVQSLRRGLRDAAARRSSRFKEAGLGSIPGGGGEILVDRVRNRIAPLKCNSDQWLEVMRIAHRARAELELATMMFGHVETRRGPDRASAPAARGAGRDGRLHRVHLLDLPAGAHGAEGGAGGSHEYLRMQALSRVFLDNSTTCSLLGDAGPEDRPGGAPIRRERFRQRDDGGERRLRARARASAWIEFAFHCVAEIMPGIGTNRKDFARRL
jgi:cyclic dehypoxanthinyl futalosine synthase